MFLVVLICLCLQIIKTNEHILKNFNVVREEDAVIEFGNKLSYSGHKII